jgi:hypothetical protein
VGEFMKGVSLPISVIVILMLAVAVLAGALYIYRSGWQPGARGAGMEAAFNSACLTLTSRGCKSADLDTIPANYDVDGNGDPSDDELLDLCSYYGYGNVACMRACGCLV